MDNKNQASLRQNYLRAPGGCQAGGLLQITNWTYAALRCCALVLVAVGVVGSLLATSEVTAAPAAQERYKYGLLGKLIAHVDGSGVAPQYRYDSASDILSVVRGSATELAAPQLTDISPAVIRRGDPRRIALTGTNLQNTSFQVNAPAVGLANIERASVNVAFDMSVSNQVALGPLNVVVGNP